MKQLFRILPALSLYGLLVVVPAAAAESVQPINTQLKPAPSKVIPFKSEPKTLGTLVGQSLLTLLVVIGVTAGVLYLAKRHFPRLKLNAGSGKRLALIETMRLTPKSTLFVIRFDDDTILLGQHGDSINVLTTQTPVSHPPTPPPT